MTSRPAACSCCLISTLRPAPPDRQKRRRPPVARSSDEPETGHRARDLFPERGHREEHLRRDARQEIEHVGRRCEVGLVAERVADAQLAEPEDVRHRQPQQIAIALGEQREVAAHPVRAVRADVRVRERHALRVAGGAARVEHLAGRVERDRAEARVDERGRGGIARGGGADRAVVGDRRVGLPRARRQIDDDGFYGELLDHRLGARALVLAGDEHDLALGVLEDVADLIRRRRRIDRHEHDARRLRAERGARPRDRVRREDRDAVAGLDVVLDQPARDAADLRRELAPRDWRPAVAGADLEARAVAVRGEAIEHRVRRGLDLREGVEVEERGRRGRRHFGGSFSSRS